MDRTTVSQTQMQGYFLSFLSGASTASDAMILSIPKKDTMILGNNTGIEDNKYILPEYIIGKLTLNQDGEIEFIENPIPMNERRVYENKYEGYKTNEMEGKILPIKALQNALLQGTIVDKTIQAATLDKQISTAKTFDRRRRVRKDD